MKKKMMIFLCLAVMAGSIAACGGREDSTTQNKEQKEENKETGEEKNAESELDIPEGLNYLYIDPDFGYSMYIQEDYKSQIGWGYVAYVGDGSDTIYASGIYITKYAGDVGDDEQKEIIDMNKYTDSTDIFELLLPNLKIEYLQLEIGYELEDYSVDIVETKVIAGVEMTKFEGKLDVVADPGKEWERRHTYPIVAYGIKTKKTPVLVCFVDRSKDSIYHEYWVDKIDDVVSTFREGE